VSVEHLQAGLDSSGKVTAWLHRSVAPSIGSIFGPDPKHELPFEQGMGLVNLPFDIPNLRIENPAADAHVRIGWYRAVSNIPHAFAIQSFVAELAAAAGRDPKDYLLELIGPARASIRARSATPGITPSPRSSIPSIRGVCAASSRPWQARRAGDASSPPGKGWVLPRTTTSSRTRRRWCTSR
jgi:CO/xanthine dehydrogenase Mo-binding subunit